MASGQLSGIRDRGAGIKQWLLAASQRRLGVAFGLLVMLCLVAPTSAWAAEPERACEPVLRPLSSSGRLGLVAYVLEAKLSCQGESCTLGVEQGYFIENKENRAITLRLSLEPAARPELTDLVLRDVKGNVLPPLGSDPPLNTTWEVTLERLARRDLFLTYRYALPAALAFRWCARTAPLSAWGPAESARLTFEWPAFTSRRALLYLEPPDPAFDGKALTWNYENLSAWPDHQLVCLSPHAWGELLRLNAAGDHRGLAHLLMAIQEDAARAGLSHVDRFPEIVAELQAAIQANPHDVTLRLELAQLYRARAEAKPEMRLNYLLLAAQELAAALEKQPGDRQLAEALGLTYYQAALAASESGDPAGGLAYLKKARSIGAQAGLDEKKGEELTLRWALSLAEQGRVSQALDELAEVLSPELESALLRYAPPFASARTEVTLEPGMRTVRYAFRLYSPTASKARARLEELAVRLGSADGCHVSLETAPPTATLEVRLAFRSPDDYQARAVALVEHLAIDPDLLSAFLSAPWESALQAHEVDRGYWYDRYLYREALDLRPLQEIWETESQFARWRLVELRNASPADERSQWEQRFGQLLLREQVAVWESLPAGSHWIYRLRYPPTPEASINVSWLVGWGQQRELALDHRVYHWPAILQAAGIAGMAFVVLVAVALFRPRRERMNEKG